MSGRIVAIVLNFNGYDVTRQCVRSLLETNHPDLFVTVVDNGSIDGSVDRLPREFPGVTFLVQGQNLGFAAGCNVGIRHAMSEGAEYALLLNNDAFVAPDFVSQVLSAIEVDPGIAAVCPKIFFAEHPRTVWYGGSDFSLWTGVAKHYGWKAIDAGQFEHQHDITLLTGCAMLVRCSAVRDVGLLDEQFWAYAEDLDWSLRFRKKRYRMVFAPRAHVWHHDGATAVALGSGSQSVRQFLSTRNMVFIARKHLSWPQIPGYAVGFSLSHVAFYTVLRLWKRDFRALCAIYKGLIQGFSAPLFSSTDKLNAQNLLSTGTPAAAVPPRQSQN